MIIENAFAQLPSPPDLTPLSPDVFGGSLAEILYFIVRALLVLAGAFAVIYIIYAGFLFLTSAGDPERAQKGRNGILYAVIGFVVIALAYLIVNAVGDVIRGGTLNNPGSPGSGPGQQSAPGEGRLPTGSGPGGTGNPSAEGPSQLEP